MVVCFTVEVVINMSRRRIDGNSLNRQVLRMSKRQRLALSCAMHCVGRGNRKCDRPSGMQRSLYVVCLAQSVH